MRTTLLDSTAVYSGSYNNRLRRLTLTFDNGTFHYWGFTWADLKAFLSAPSLGKHLNTVIKAQWHPDGKHVVRVR